MTVSLRNPPGSHPVDYAALWPSQQLPLIPAPPQQHTVLHNLLAGMRFIAGLGHSTVLPSHDFETYSEAGHLWDAEKRRWTAPVGSTKRGLKAVGTAVYAQHPSTEVLCYCYDLKDGRGRRRWRPGLPNPQELFDHIARGGLLEAWNTAFEWWIWNEVCTRLYGWPALPLKQTRCVMARARAWGLPGALADAGNVLNCRVQKGPDGDRLLKKFSVPRNPTKADPRLRIRPEDDLVDGPLLWDYNEQDVAAEDEIALKVPDLEGDELEFWLADQAINARGVAIDKVSVDNCAAVVTQCLAQYNHELYHVTQGAVGSGSEVEKLTNWLHTYGIHMDDGMDEDAVTDELAKWRDRIKDDPLLGAEMQAPLRALEIRQAVGSASVKKVFAMSLQSARGDRLHNLFAYHAARTGRPTGNGPQPTNLFKGGPTLLRCGYSGSKKIGEGCGHFHKPDLDGCPWCGRIGPPARSPYPWDFEGAADVLQILRTRDLRTVEMFFGNALLAIAGCLRALFVAGPGKQLVCADYTAIEAVVAAVLANERWRIDVFVKGTDIYLESISRSTGTPLETLQSWKKEHGSHHPLRQGGKINELALGFGGWITALRSMGKTTGIEVKGTDDELKKQIISWRNASPCLIELWGGQSDNFGRNPRMFGLEGAAVQAVQNPGTWFHAMRLDKQYSGASFLVHDNVLYMRLPTGRHLAYHRPRLTPTGTWKGLELSFEGWNTNAKKGKAGWQRMKLYSGLWFENLVQATARDIQRNAINICERTDYPVVLHVYDEDVAEVRLDQDCAGLEQRMGTLPAFAQGWPVKVPAGWTGTRYRKD